MIVWALQANAHAPTTPQGWGAASRAVAAVLYWLGLAAIWFGLSNAVFGNMIDASQLRNGLAPGGGAALGSRLAVLGILCVCQCLLAWGIVSYVVGLRGPGLPVLAMLILASAVGLALGLLIVAMAPRPEIAWTIVALFMLPLLTIGDGQRAASWARTVANALPTRWAFEGLLLIESERFPPKVATEDSDPVADQDLAEGFFPADSERMGATADAMALGSMLVGFAAAAGFVSLASRPTE